MKQYLLNNLILFSVTLFSVSEAADESWKLYDDTQVAVVEITMNPEAVIWMYANPESDSLHLAVVHFRNKWIDEEIDSVGVRIRGNTSRQAYKKSLKLSFNTFVPRRQFYDVEKINLNGEHNDPSIIRSKLCWDLFQSIGVTASRACHTAVYINGVYYGLFISVEHIDEEFLKNHFEQPGGNLWKCLWPADLTYRGREPENYYPYHDPVRPYELITNTDLYDFSGLASFIGILNNTAPLRFPDAIESVLNVKLVLQYMAMDILTGSWDDYWSLMNNYYLYLEPESGIFQLIPYDYDNTFGIDWFEVPWETANPYDFPKVTDGPRPMVENLLAIPQYRNLYTHFLEYYSANVTALSHMEDRIDSLKAMITEWAELDTFRTLDGPRFTISDFHNSYALDGYSNAHVKRGLKEFIDLRNNDLLGQLEYVEAPPVVYDVNWYPETPYQSDSITVTAQVFSYTGLDSVMVMMQPGDLDILYVYPMKYEPIPGTMKVENNDRWIATLPPAGEYSGVRIWITATDLNERTDTNLPRTVQLIPTPSSDILINEFLARNTTINTDPSGEFDDWVELYNSSDREVDLSGYYLTDNPANPSRWMFPEENSLIPGYGYLLVWCDDDAGQEGLHANFKLDGDGEFIALVEPDGMTFIDSLTFAAQTDDNAYGRHPDGSGDWFFMYPTPGSSNSTTGNKPDGRKLPESLALRVYPNPFNGTLTMHYQVPVISDVSIRIYDVLGKCVSVYDEKKQPPGSYIKKWSAFTAGGRDLSSGIYLLQLRAGEKTELRKLLLIK